MPGSSEPQDAASMHKLNTATVQSARRRKHARTQGAAGCGVEAQYRRRRASVRARVRTGASPAWMPAERLSGRQNWL